VRPGALFAALPGTTADGRDFLADAVRGGASAVLAPLGTAWPAGSAIVPIVEVSEPRRALARIAAVLAGPQPDAIVAITGTNGKTSTAEFCRQLWTLVGKRAASLGTLGLRAPDDVVLDAGPALTTPDPVALAGTLAALTRAGVERAAMEASSHGLAQFRLDGVTLRAAGFSNLTRDHLDYHGTEAAYRAAKLRLFDEILPRGAAVSVNADADPATLGAIADITAARGLTLSSVGERGATIRLVSVRPMPNRQIVGVVADGVPREFNLPLAGRYQIDNALLAASLVASAEGRPVGTLIDRLEHLDGVRGRMELACVLANGSAAYVDYAHTPDGLERALSSIRPHASGRVVVVFGAGGDRDRGKRPLMGAIAVRLADVAIVTDDNPRFEKPATIRSEILAGAKGAREIGDREAAIAAGLAMLAPGDVLVVAGKGHEVGQSVEGTTLPFDDREVLVRLAGGPVR
jgi:UDP-N-acetylmuramoyl-L-alanyl-D-glutamate--2,6-diaminopimelate ligase